MFSLQKLLRRGETEKLGSDLREYLDNVALWRGIYSGETPWCYTRKGGLDGGTRKMSSLSAARAVCSELSAMIFSQQVDFRYENAKTEGFVLRVLGENRFWTAFPLFLERVLAVGCGVVKCYVEGGKIRLDYLGGESFIPTQYDEKGVYGGVIVSRISNGAPYTLLERHERTGEGYVITNRLFKGEECDKETELSELFPELSAKTVIKGLKNPLFVFFRPCSGGFGGIPCGSVLFGSADVLRALDVALDSLEREFVLGKKRIIVPVSAVRGEYDRSGRLKKYFDTGDEVYQAFSADDKEELKIVDNTSVLRVSEHTEAIEALLDMLCLQLGLSAGALSYRGGSVKTAAEVISRDNKSYRTKTAHQQLIREGLIELCRVITLLGAVTGAVSPTTEEASVCFADSVMQDNGARIDNAIKLYNAGLIDKERALSEIMLSE